MAASSACGRGYCEAGLRPGHYQVASSLRFGSADSAFDRLRMTDYGRGQETAAEQGNGRGSNRRGRETGAEQVGPWRRGQETGAEQGNGWLPAISRAIIACLRSWPQR